MNKLKRDSVRLTAYIFMFLFSGLSVFSGFIFLSMVYNIVTGNNDTIIQDVGILTISIIVFMVSSVLIFLNNE